LSDTVETSGARGHDVAALLRGRAASLGTAELLERTEELSRLREQIAEVAASSRGRLVLVQGETGIGKTALLRRFCDDIGERARVLWASCDPLFTPRPLGPLLDIARVTDGELRARVESGAKPHDVVAAFIAELESPTPTLVVLEDLHWADEATLDVVRLLARRLQSVPAVVVLSYCDEQLHHAHPLRIVLGELSGVGPVTRMELVGLSRQAVAALAERSTIDRDELYEKTAGNPFFVTETLATDTDQVPPTVRDAVLARSARLTAAGRSVLEAVAVVPQRTEIWLLEALSGGALEGLDDCLSSGMLRAELDGVVFRHELARLAVEQSLAPDRMVMLHRRAVTALESPALGAPDHARLAHHAEAAGDLVAVLRFAPEAAAHASAVGAHREAEAQYSRALRVGDRIAPEARADLLERFASECYFTDMREQGLAALDQALMIHRKLGNALKQGEMQQLRGRMMACIGRIREAKVVFTEAIELLEPLPHGRELARAYSCLSETMMLCSEAGETIKWATLGSALAERVDDAEALALALNSLGYIELLRGLPEGREKLERSLEVAKQADLPIEVGRAYINLMAALGNAHDYLTLDQYADAATDYCRAHGLEAWLRYAICLQADSHLVQGRWAEAAAAAASVVNAPLSAVLGARTWALCLLGLVRARRGDPGYWPLLDEASEAARTINELQYSAMVALVRAEAAWLEGRSAAIGPETESAFKLALELGAPLYVGELACWRWRVGLLTEAPPDAEEVYRHQIGGHAEQAITFWSDRGFRYETALARFDSDDPKEMRRALDEFRALEATPAAAIVARRLRELGERSLPRGPRPQTRANPHGLTARELQVLPLIAEGLRNAEIARRLIVSQKTVDHHVSAILRKLDVQTRGEAAARATQLGLGGPA
jgi:DNA-binding CsgD family transcriptional regulator/tetratricopeptide (TPR) repeat protein